MNISPERFRDSFSRLPFTIREYLMGDQLGLVIQEVGSKYGLHVDTIGALDREVSNMLLGLENPQQFIGELKSVGIQEISIAPMVQELNERIFIPLHKKMQDPNASKDPGFEDEEILREVAESIGIIEYPNVSTPNLDVQILKSSVPAPVYAQVPVYIPPPAPLAPTVPPSVSQYSANTAFPSAPVVKQTPAIPQPSEVPTPQFSPENYTAPAQQPTRVTVPTLAPVQAPQPSVQPQQRVQTDNRDALHKILKEYGVDPYRETFDDKGA